MTEQTNPLVIFDIDGVIRDVGGSYRRALADTVEHFTDSAYRPTPLDIDQLKSEGIWNNDWEASQELIYRYFQNSIPREQLQLTTVRLSRFFNRVTEDQTPTIGRVISAMSHYYYSLAILSNLHQLGFAGDFLAVLLALPLPMFCKNALV
jgi:HAD superfamily hydrolase (TIGR01548 family)